MSEKLKFPAVLLKQTSPLFGCKVTALNLFLKKQGMLQTAMSFVYHCCKMTWKGALGNLRQTSSIIGNLLKLIYMFSYLKLVGQEKTSERGKVK